MNPDDDCLCCFMDSDGEYCRRIGGNIDESPDNWDGNWFCKDHRGKTEWEAKQ